ncbi:unnamed protein product, partial [Rotaria sp. Silwood2]
NCGIDTNLKTYYRQFSFNNNNNNNNKNYYQFIRQEIEYRQQMQTINDEAANDIHFQEILSSKMDIVWSMVQLNNDYNSLTLNSRNENKRLSYLPCFPLRLNEKPSNSSSLLLANVPRCCLSLRQLLQRDSEQFYFPVFHQPIMYHHPHYEYQSFMYYMFYKHFSNLKQRLKVNVSIIDYNLSRLHSFITNEYSKIIQQNNKSNTLSLDYDEMALALEYYLQMDVDLFYMKTCSFGDAQSYASDVGLFHNEHNFEIRYSLQPCQQINCCLCQTSSSSSSPSTIRFKSFEIHRFSNGYESILNCPATCQTKNIIYLFTCPCGKCEFIGSTKESLMDVIFYYRKQLNQFIHTHLTGLNSSLDSFSTPFLFCTISDSLLYEHITQCPTILERFLQVNPQYYCFIPMLLEHVIQNNFLININDFTTNSFSSSSTSCTINLSTGESVENEQPIHLINDEINQYITKLPKLSKNTVFTSNQRKLQRNFFHQCISKQEVIVKSSDLYNITLLCVLPEYASCRLRTVIQALYILHVEPRLNQ